MPKRPVLERHKSYTSYFQAPPFFLKKRGFFVSLFFLKKTSVLLKNDWRFDFGYTDKDESVICLKAGECYEIY